MRPRERARIAREGGQEAEREDGEAGGARESGGPRHGRAPLSVRVYRRVPLLPLL